MRIIGLKEFLELPEGTLFQKYEPSVFGHLELFHGKTLPDDPESIDFIASTVVGEGDFQEAHCSSSHDNLLDEAEVNSQKVIRLQYDVTCRDGLYERNQLFAVYDREDVLALMNHLGDILTRPAYKEGT